MTHAATQSGGGPATGRRGKAMVRRRRASGTRQSKFQHAGIQYFSLGEIQPAPENDQIYRPVDPKDPDIRALAESIEKHGLREPLVVTVDGYILSGHRRYVAAHLAGLRDVPCRVEEISRTDDLDAFVRLLREYNRQRNKSLDEKLREEVICANPEEAYESLIEHRRQAAAVGDPGFEIIGTKSRAAISRAKQPFLDAIQAIIEVRSAFWPLSDRQIHYALLNDPPLKHASKPDSIYTNDRQSYESLVDLLTRARLEGLIPWKAIADPTRPVTIWTVWSDPQPFIRDQMDKLLKTYWRNLQQSQPNHIEIVGEKNTVASILKPIAAEYCVPMTIGRGYASLPPRYEMAQRFYQSGKEKLILLLLSDFDPDGEEIAHSFARSMRDDFGVESIVPIKVALTAQQVREYELPPVMQAKDTSAHFKKFTEAHGHDVYELEALDPAALQQILRQHLDASIDVKAFNAELDAEKKDAAFLDVMRRRVYAALAGANGRALL